MRIDRLSSKLVPVLPKLKAPSTKELSAFSKSLLGPAKSISRLVKYLLCLAKRLPGLPKTLSHPPKYLLCITKPYFCLVKYDL